MVDVFAVWIHEGYFLMREGERNRYVKYMVA